MNVDTFSMDKKNNITVLLMVTLICQGWRKKNPDAGIYGDERVNSDLLINKNIKQRPTMKFKQDNSKQTGHRLTSNR